MSVFCQSRHGTRGIGFFSHTLHRRSTVGTLVPGATHFGTPHRDHPAIAAMQDETLLGWVFLTSDLVPTTGYSGKPIHVLVGVSLEGVITGVRLVHHDEPIVLVGIPESRISAVTEAYQGFDLHNIDKRQSDDIDIVSGATVTIMVIDDSILRGGLKLARLLGLNGFTQPNTDKQPLRKMNLAAPQAQDGKALSGMDPYAIFN